MTKQTVGRASDLLGAAAIMAFGEPDPDLNYIESLEMLIRIELEALGLTEKEIELAARFSLHPQDSRIEKLIEDFEPNESSWATITPFTLRAYTQRLEILEMIDDCQSRFENESERWLSPEQWLNRGAELAWYSYAADMDYIQTLNKAEFGAIGGRGRAGKIFSPAKIAISYALSNGFNSAEEVKTYFETEPVIDEHDIEVYCERDESGEPESFSFMNLSNRVMSRPMKSTTLPSAVSQTKAYLKNQ